VRTIKQHLRISLIFLLAACSKNSHTSGDVTPPVITITSPLNNEHFAAGEIISTVASATDDNEVTELHIHVINKATGELLRDIHSYPAKTSGTVQDSFAADAGIIYTIQIIAKDPAQNVATAKVEVSSN
jgi:Big-like domain-containing protein